MNEIVIVGASLAGAATARALRDAGYAGGLTVVGEEPHAPYDRPPLSKSFLLDDLDEADLALVDAEEKLGVAWRIGEHAHARARRRHPVASRRNRARDRGERAAAARHRWAGGHPRLAHPR
jgi:NADPH-dependent 2,4-dienoyl-CoA reductase/sulfur reductase-like enzyme